MRGRVKYYLRQPKAGIAKDIMLWLVSAGVVVVAGSSPYFAVRAFQSWGNAQHQKRSVETAFYRLRKGGHIAVEQKNHKYHVCLTDEGRQKAGWLQINSLKVSKSKKWKGGWFMLLFDINQGVRWKRDILRSFLERLEFKMYQKSVWVHPYDPTPELDVLKKFLGLTSKELKIISVPHLGEDETIFQKRFNLRIPRS